MREWHSMKVTCCDWHCREHGLTASDNFPAGFAALLLIAKSEIDVDRQTMPWRLCLVFACLLLAAAAHASSCSTLQSCVDSATISQNTLNITLPAALDASSHNCNVSINGNSRFNRVILTGSGQSPTVIDCSASGTVLLSPARICLTPNLPHADGIYAHLNTHDVSLFNPLLSFFSRSAFHAHSFHTRRISQERAV
jgi:hypothetical protein